MEKSPDDDARSRALTSSPTGVMLAAHPYRRQLPFELRKDGDWTEAAIEAQKAADWLVRTHSESDAGAVYYQWAEVLRLRGDITKAEEAYRNASQAGRRPYPGLALLHLARGDEQAAAAMSHTRMKYGGVKRAGH